MSSNQASAISALTPILTIRPCSAPGKKRLHPLRHPDSHRRKRSRGFESWVSEEDLKGCRRGKGHPSVNGMGAGEAEAGCGAGITKAAETA